VSGHVHVWETVGYLDKPWYTWKYFGWAIERCTECGQYVRGHLADGDNYPMTREPIEPFIGPLIAPDVIYEWPGFGVTA